jgi:DnaJ-domain-containing protein 1
MATSLLFRNNWFGKALFTTGAFAIAPIDPTSTIIWTAVGFGLGYQFDQFAAHDHLTLKQSANAWRLLRQTKHHNPWMIFTFAALGAMARIAGKNNHNHRSQARRLMQDLRFDPKGKERARSWYQAGLEDGCPLPELAARCRAFGHYEFEPFAVQSLAQAAALSDRTAIEVPSQLALRGFRALLGFEIRGAAAQKPPDDAPPDLAQGAPGPEPVASNPSSVADARRLLGVEATADKAKVKLAYRRLASQHHPDRLPEDASKAQRQQAQAKMADINSAKDLLDTALT